MRRPCLTVAVLISTVLISTVCWAEDTDQTRFYFGVRAGIGITGSGRLAGEVDWEVGVRVGVINPMP